MEQINTYYFAYGSNMSSEVLVGRRGIRPLSQCNAVLSDYELVFEAEGIRFLEPCFASVKPQPGSSVYGILYELSPQDVERLHKTEGASYRIEEIVVSTSAAREQRCFTYTSGHFCTGRKPSRRYMDILIRGAKEHHLPDDYVSRLQAVETFHIPVLSSLVGVLIHYLSLYISSGRTLNIPFVKLGAGRTDNSE